MARVNAVLKRRDASTRSKADVMRFKGLEINIPARTVTVDGKRVDLTPKEYELLFYLIQNRDIALSRDKLLSDIWGYDFFGDDRTIDTHIKNLKNALGPYRSFIVTLRGVGYKFECRRTNLPGVSSASTGDRQGMTVSATYTPVTGS